MRRLLLAALAALALGLSLLPVPTAAQVYSRGSLTDQQTVPFGTGTAAARIHGTLTTSIAAVCTAADTIETDLWTYTLPANTLATDGRGVRLIVSATFAANANGKALRTYVGIVNVASSSAVVGGTPNNVPYFLNYSLLRTGTASEYLFGWVGSGLTSYAVPPSSALISDTTGAIILKVTGQNTVATANDICVRAVVVETI